MKMLSREEAVFFEETQGQHGIAFEVSVEAGRMLTSSLRRALPRKCEAIIAGGFPRDCLLRDGEWSDVDIFIYPAWINDTEIKFSPLSQALVNHPNLVLGLLRKYEVKTNTISYALYLYKEGESAPSGLHSRLYRLTPCVKLGATVGGSDGLPLSFRGDPGGPISNFNIMLRDENSIVNIIHTFPINLSRAYITLFPTDAHVHTTVDFDQGVAEKKLTVTKLANMNVPDLARLQNYLGKVSRKFPDYSTVVIDTCPF